MLQQYIRRNLPVFVIGIATVGIFLVVIVLSNTSDNSQSLLPELRKVSEDEISTEFDATQNTNQQTTPTISNSNDEQIIETENGLIITESPQALAEKQAGLDAAYMDAAQVKQTHPVLEILFTADVGFVPRKAKGYQYQTVRFVNNSSASIVLSQTGLNYTFWETDKSIAPGSSLEFELEKAGLWTYTEKTLKQYGSILAEKAVN